MANRYVATNGNNGWPGTIGQPWRDIQYGYDNINAGDYLYIRGGTYTEGLITFAANGSSGNEYHIGSYNSETVIITQRLLVSGDYHDIWDMEFITSTSSPQWPLKELTLYGNNNVFTDMYLHDYTGDIYNGGILVGKPDLIDASYNTFYNTNIIWSGSIYISTGNSQENVFLGGEVSNAQGMLLRYGGLNNTVDGFELHDPGRVGSGGNDADGMNIHGDGHVLRNCRVYNVFRQVPTQHSDALQWWVSTNDLLIENNIIGSAATGGIYNEGDYGHIMWSGISDRITIRNNVFLGTGSSLVINNNIPATVTADDWVITNNVFRATAPIRDPAPEGVNWIIKNNIFYSHGRDFQNGAGYDVDNNLYVAGASMSIWDGPGSLELSSANFINDDMSATTNYGIDANWRLQPNSPAIDIGTSNDTGILDADDNPRYDDPATPNGGTGTYPYYDIGAFEYQGDADLAGASNGLCTASATLTSPIKLLIGQSDGGSTAEATLYEDETTPTNLADSWCRADNQTANYGGDDGLYVFRKLENSWGRATVLRFDFNYLPAGATIDIATLLLHCRVDDGAGVDIYCRHLEGVGNAFTEMGVNWDTYDGSNQWDSGDLSAADYTIANQAYDTSTGLNDHWFEWNITAMVQHCYDNHSKILEVIITTDVEDAYYFYFDSRDWSVEAERPKLEITYSTSGEELCAGQSDGGSTVSALAEITKTIIGASDGIATANGAVSPIRSLEGASDGTSTTGALTDITKTIIGSSIGVSIAEIPTLKRTRIFAGTSDGLSIALALLGAIIEQLVGVTTGTSVVESTLAVTRGFVGLALGNSTTEASIEVSKDMVLTSNGSSTVDGLVKPIRAFDGSSAGIATVYDIPGLLAVRILVGFSNGIASVDVVFNVTKKLNGQTNGTATATQVLKVVKEITSSIACTSTVTATLRDIKGLVGQSDGTSLCASLLLKASAPLGGISDGVATVVGVLSISRSLASLSAGTSTVGAVLSITKELVGASGGTSTAEASIEETTYLNIDTIQGDSTVVAVLEINKKLACIANGTSNVGGTLDADSWLAGNSDGGSLAIVSIEISKKLVGAANGVALSTALLDVLKPMLGAANGLSTSAGNVMITRGVISQTDGSSITTALVKILKTLSSLSAGTSTASVNLEEKTSMRSTSNGTSLVNGNLAVNITLVGASNGSSTATATLLEKTALAGVTDGVSTVSAVLKAENKFAGITAGNSTVIASSIKLRRLNCDNIFGTAITDASIVCIRGLIGQANGLSTIGATLQERTRLYGNSVGSSLAEVSVNITKKLSTFTVGDSTVVGLAKVLKELVGQTNGLSNVDNVLLKVDKELSGTSTGVSTVGAPIYKLARFAGSSRGMAVVIGIPTGMLLYITRELGCLSNGASTASVLSLSFVVLALAGAASGRASLILTNLAIGTVFTTRIAGTSTTSLALSKIRWHQLGYSETSRVEKGSIVVIRPK